MLTVPVMSQPFEKMIYLHCFPLIFYKLCMMLFIRKTVLFCGHVIFCYFYTSTFCLSLQIQPRQCCVTVDEAWYRRSGAL